MIGEAVERIDDSDGELSDAAQDMAQAHLEACRLLLPDPAVPPSGSPPTSSATGATCRNSTPPHTGKFSASPAGRS
ncbi:hypothetical protein [Streptomyces inhibens]|uniref:hypothetical protein n=1 Tax=Streptomyces inhibens TaxID=2293571 RepID=UPI001FD3627A|nr:hypothetical protein [Streptomyces inhibens]